MAAQYPTAAGTDANLYIAVNNLSTSLTDNPLTSGATTVNVVSTTGFPTAGHITIEAEAISYTGTTATSFTTCTRGADGTTAASHVNGLSVQQDVLAAHHNVLKDEIKAVESDLVNCMAAITPVTAASTATSALQRLAHIVSQIKNGFGLTNWYDAVTAMLPKSGGTMTGAILTPDGLVSAPSVAFSAAADQNTGLYRIGTGNVGMTVQGTQICRINSNGIIINTGNLLFNSTSTNGILGSTTNDSAAAGNVGEAVRSAVSTPTNFPSSTTYGDLTSISLTAGDWDVTAVIAGFSNGTTTFTQMRFGIGTASGSTAPTAEGDNYVITQGSTTVDVSGCVPNYRMSLSGTTTVYLKFRADSTGTVPQAVGRISARRIR